MRAHELQREDAHANRDEQQREEYRELFSIIAKREEGFSRKAQSATKWFCFALLCAFA